MGTVAPLKPVEESTELTIHGDTISNGVLTLRFSDSGEIASCSGPFPGFETNREPMLRVIAKHRQALSKCDPGLVPERLLAAADEAGAPVLAIGGGVAANSRLRERVAAAAVAAALDRLGPETAEILRSVPPITTSK